MYYYISKITYKIKQIFTNKVLLFLVSRYFTYFIQFFTSIYIANKLGPYYFGIWGFILMLINYLCYINFGISNSLNILMAQNIKNIDKSNNYVASSFFLINVLSIVILCIAVYYAIWGINYFEKYEIGNFFYFICLIGILYHYNTLFSTIYRIKNRLFEIAFQQSIIPFLVCISIFIFSGKDLLVVLLIAYIVGHLISLILFICNKQIHRGGKISIKNIKIVLSKGSFLFLYNACFFFIVLSNKTVVSTFYSVEEFGFFTFSYTLANAILLLFQAFNSVIFPKIINKLDTDDISEVERVLSILRINSVTVSYLLIFIALILFPLLISFMPKYQNTLFSLNLTALAVVISSNSIYSNLLLAKNREKTLSTISIVSLFVNILLSLIIVKVFHASYEYVIISMIFSYFLFCYLTTYFGRKVINKKCNFLLVSIDFFPIRLFIPYLAAITLVLFRYEYLIFIPFILFILLNIKQIKQIFHIFKTILVKPSIVDIDTN